MMSCMMVRTHMMVYGVARCGDIKAMPASLQRTEVHLVAMLY